MNKHKKLSALCIGTELAPTLTVSLVSAFTKEDRAIPSPESKPALVGKKIVKVELISNPPTEIDFETPKPSDRPTDLTSKEPSMGNSTTEPLLTPTLSQPAPVEPKIGDTRIVDEQKQVYFLGFDWIEAWIVNIYLAKFFKVSKAIFFRCQIA